MNIRTLHESVQSQQTKKLSSFKTSTPFIGFVSMRYFIYKGESKSNALTEDIGNFSTPPEISSLYFFKLLYLSRKMLKHFISLIKP